MVMTGILKLWKGLSEESRRKISTPSSLDHPIQDLEEEALLLIVQLILTLLSDLLVHLLLPTEEFDHTYDVHDLSDDLHT